MCPIRRARFARAKFAVPGALFAGAQFSAQGAQFGAQVAQFSTAQKVWAQFDAKSARGPICQGPICLEPSIGNGGPEPPTIYIFGILSAYKDSVGTNPIKISLRFFAEGKIFQTFHFSLNFHAMAEKKYLEVLVLSSIVFVLQFV